jgi:23S rRNA (uracil1939-C5)-methyltransferase
MNKKTLEIIPNVQITDISADGQGIAKHNGLVIFINKVVPGDVVTIQLIKKKKNFAEAKLISIQQPSNYRITPQCPHFDVCGGCKWQNLDYQQQLLYKEKHVQDCLIRIGKLKIETIEPILGCENIFYYRNKMDFGFTNKRWLYDFEKQQQEETNHTLNLNAVGFHIPGRFDKIFNVTDCKLQAPYNNLIRNAIYEYALKNNLTFFDLKNQTGLLRSLIIRNNLLDEWMVIIVFKENNSQAIHNLMTYLKDNFKKIKSLYYVINTKRNETIYDLPLHLFSGKPYLTEKLNEFTFKINPKSFFQTNPQQTHTLYQLALTYAELTGNEIVYDLYTGTGTIAIYLASKAQKVIGIEAVEEAIADAKENAQLNNLNNLQFFAGDMKDVLTQEFVNKNGKPSVIIADPPRAGMHPTVINRILEIEPQRIVYVSCNPATQARDLSLLSKKYIIKKSRAVDMFPHTQHVENVVQLIIR